MSVLSKQEVDYVRAENVGGKRSGVVFDLCDTIVALDARCERLEAALGRIGDALADPAITSAPKIP